MRYGYRRFSLEAENRLVRKSFAIRCENSVLVDAVEIVVVVVFGKFELHDTDSKTILCISTPAHAHSHRKWRTATRHMCALTCFPNGFYLFPVSFVLFVLGIRHMINAFTVRGMYLDCNTHKNRQGDMRNCCCAPFYGSNGMFTVQWHSCK